MLVKAVRIPENIRSKEKQKQKASHHAINMLILVVKGSGSGRL